MTVLVTGAAGRIGTSAASAADLGDACSYDSDRYVGGGFTSPGFGIDEVAARAR